MADFDPDAYLADKSPVEAPAASHEPSQRDVHSLARMIESEAGGTPEIAMRGVAHAAMNHAAGRSITDVLTHGTGGANGHYGPQEEGRYASTAKEPSPASIKIAQEVLSGKSTDPTGGAVQWDSPQAYADPERAHVVAASRASEGKHIVTLPGVPASTFRFYAPKGKAASAPTAAFDPDAYLASKSPAAASSQPPPAAPPAETPGATESFLRSASNAVSSNFVNPIAAGVTHLVSGQPYADALKGINESDAAATAAHPTASTAGTVAGTGLQMVAPLPVPKGIGPAATGALVGGGFSALQGAGDTLNAGGSLPEAAANAGRAGAVGMATGAVLGKLTVSLVGGAPERVDEQIIANIANGEAGGRAKASVADKMLAKKDVLPQLEQTGLTKTVATQAAAKPAAVADKVTKVIDQYTTQRIDPIYAAIDKAGAAPKAYELKAALQQVQDKLTAAGEWQQAAHVGKYIKFVDASVPDATQLTGTMLRKARNEVGLGNTFASHEEGATPAGVAAKREIYSAYNAAIEGAAARVPGVDVASLKSANQTVSTLLTVRDTLANRATKASKGGTGFGTAVAGGIVRGGEAMALGGAVLHALSTGDITSLAHVAQGIVATEAGRYAITHAAPQAIRSANYGLSRLELAARGGSLPARAASGALTTGANVVAAPSVGRLLHGPYDQDQPQ